MFKKLCAAALIFIGLILTLAPDSEAQNEQLKLEILNGHSGGGVLSVAVSADGRFALTGSTDKTALLWDLETGKQLRRFVGHEDAVDAVAFSKDGQFVLTASWDKTARLWETATGRLVRVFGENRNGLLVGHSGKILSAAISADGNLAATAGEDKTARIWDLKTGKQLFEIEHAGRVNSIAFSPDSTLLLTGGEDKIARLYSTSNGKLVRQFVGHTGEITSVAYSPDGKQVLTGSYDKTVRFWNIENSSETKKYKTSNTVLTVAFTQNKGIIIADADGHCFWINLDKKVWKSEVNGYFLDDHFHIINGNSLITITPDEKRILIASNEYVSVIDVAKNKEVQRLNGRSNVTNSISLSPNFDFIFSATGYHSTSGLWNLKTGQLMRLWNDVGGYQSVSDEIEEEVIESQITNGSFLPDSNIYAVSDGSFIYSFDVTGTEVGQRLGNSDGVITKSIAFSPDGRFVLTGNSDNTVRLWQYANKFNDEFSKGFLRDFVGHQKPINNVAFSIDGKTIATASNDKTVRLWNAETSEVKQIIKDFLAPVWSVAFSPDGKTIAAASGGEVDMSKVGIGDAASANGVRFFDVETGKEIDGFGGEFKSSANRFAGFKSVAYSPDGQFLAAGSFDGKVYLRDNETKQIRKFEGHTDAVNSVKFAKDANGNLLVVSGSSDSTTRIWNAATGEEICALVTFRDGNWAVVQTRTGRYDAPNGGEIDGIQWVYGNETIALNQLKDIYYTPNLLPRLLGYNKEPLRGVPALGNLKLFPKIVEQSLDEASRKLTVKLKNRGGGIGAVRVSVNGKSATEDARDEHLKANPNVAEATVTFDLNGSAGLVEPFAANKIEVVTDNYDAAIGRGYISSNASQVSARGTKTRNLAAAATDAVSHPTLYAIVGGVSDYNGSQIDLNFAAKDAEDFADALEIGARRMLCPPENLKCDKVQIARLTTDERDPKNLPTKANFKTAFQEIAKKSKPEDILLVYLSGHGASLALGGADTYFYLTQEADKTSKEALEVKEYRDAAAISNQEMLDWLTQTEWRAGGRRGVDALKQILILDTCAAGAFEGKVFNEKTKDLSADQIRALERLKDRAGLQILMGSAANQSSYETTRYGQGLLTYSLLQAMKGARLRDGKFVDTALLFDYAKDTVENLVRGMNIGIQQPRIFSQSAGIDIGLMTDEDKSRIRLAAPKPFVLRPRFSSGEEGDDPLDLIGALRAKFQELSEARPRGGGGSSSNGGAALVYIDDDNFPNAFRVTGGYAVEGENVRVKAFLRRNGKTVAALPEIFAAKERAVEELTTQILGELAKIEIE